MAALSPVCTLKSGVQIQYLDDTETNGFISLSVTIPGIPDAVVVPITAVELQCISQMGTSAAQAKSASLRIISQI